MRNPAAGRQLPDLPRIQRRLRVELKAVEFTHKRELRDLARHGNPTLVAPCDLAPNQERQGLAQGHVGTGCFVQQRVELVADRRQLEPVEHRHQPLVIDTRHHQPPPISASYSASGRNRAGGGSRSADVDRTGPAAPITPERCARSTIRCRRPRHRAWSATTSPAWRTITRPPSTTTWTLSPISR